MKINDMLNISCLIFILSPIFLYLIYFYYADFGQIYRRMFSLS